MVGLVIAAVIGMALVLYAADRLFKARSQARRRAAMRDRLDAATARADEQESRRTAAAQASAALTSVMPAIERPPLTLPGVPAPGAARSKTGCEGTGPHERRSAHPGAAGPPHGPGQAGRRAARSGPHAVVARAGQDRDGHRGTPAPGD